MKVSIQILYNDYIKFTELACICMSNITSFILSQTLQIDIVNTFVSDITTECTDTQICKQIYYKHVRFTANLKWPKF